MTLPERFRENIKEQQLFSPKDKLLLAVSGGVDSVVLCELCKQAGYDFIIAHCNFKLRGEESDRDEEFVRTLAKRYNVPFYVHSFETELIAKTIRKSIEETARDLRYGWFTTLLFAPDSPDSPMPVNERPRYIVTGHHA